MSDKRFNNKNLKDAIDKSGMTREQIAESVGCDTSSITKYYNGDRYPKTDIIIRLAELFNCSTDYLLGKAKCKNANLDIEEIHQLTALSEKAITELIVTSKQIDIDGYISNPDIDVLNILIESDMFWSVLRYIKLMLEFSTIQEKEELFYNDESLTLKGYAMSDYFRNNAVNVFSSLIDDIRRLRSIDDE